MEKDLSQVADDTGIVRSILKMVFRFGRKGLESMALKRSVASMLPLVMSCFQDSSSLSTVEGLGKRWP